jgi:DNA-binding NtrC family response regulator
MLRRSHNPQLYRILLVGKDVSRLSSRANVLTLAGYSADPVLETEHAARRVRIKRYHLAIVSSSFTVDEQLAIRATLQAIRPALPVLFLTPEHDKPDAFLAAVADSLKQKKRFRFGTPHDGFINGHGVLW